MRTLLLLVLCLVVGAVPAQQVISRRAFPIAGAVEGTVETRLDDFEPQALSTEALPDIELQREYVAVAHPGDWYLLFHKRRSAERHYLQAYELMREVNPEGVVRHFGEPVLLPDISLPIDYLPRPDNYARVRLDVTEHGRARGVTVQEASEAANTVKLKRQLRRARFRPVIQDGQTIATTGMQIRIDLW